MHQATSLNGAASSAEFDPFAGPSIEVVLTTTEPQREVWLADQMSCDASLAFNEVLQIDFSGSLDVAALSRAVDAVIARHDSLRATISSDGMDMLVAEASPGVMIITDAAGDERVLADACSHAVETSFDLLAGPLFKAQLVKIDASRHTLLLAAHHVVCDGWSIGVVLRDLAAIYSGIVEGRVPELPAADSFADHVESQAASDSGDDAEVDLKFWIRQFEGDIPVLDLPADRPRPSSRSFASAREDKVLGARLLTELERVAGLADSSAFAGLLSAFAGWLGRVSGLQEVVVAVPRAGQLVEGRTNLVGHCVRTMPLRLVADASLSFDALIRLNQDRIIEAFEHPNLTYATLLKELPLPRDASRPPLVNVMFNLDRAMDPVELPFTGLTYSLSSVPRVAESFDFFMNAFREGPSLRLECQYNSGLFERATVGAWLGSFEAFLEGVARRPGDPISRVTLLDDSGVAAIRALQPVVTEYPSDSPVHELVLAMAREMPGKIAVSEGSGSLTYSQLAELAEGVAIRLASAGVRPGERVGIALDRSPRMLAALIGVLQAGAAYVPLDPGFPVDRLQFMSQDAELRFLVTQRDIADRVDFGAVQFIHLDEGDCPTFVALARAPRSAVFPAVAPESIAYVIYTSGSTGRPKGVEVPHRAVVNFLVSMKVQPGLTRDDTLVAVTTLSFDIAVLELLLPLVVGATVVLARRESAMDGSSLRSLLESCNATVMQATPEMWKLLLRAGWCGGSNFTALCGGESLGRELAASLLESAGSVWNMYGPTETTVWSTCSRVTDAARVNIGRPIANTSVWILDPDGSPAPIGMPGEICIGGDGVAVGYLKRPELTAEKFVEDRFASKVGSRLYRTGDRGRWRRDGTLEHLGRLDSQVKVRGYRIELGEIESTLRRHPTVADCVAIVREDTPGDSRIVAYCVARDDGVLDAAALRLAAKESLPDYMVPQHIVQIAALPKLPNGKLDRKSFPIPDAAASLRSDAPRAAPTTELEALVLQAIESTLSLAGMGVEDDFFTVGGHSLLAAQLAARLAMSTGHPVPLRLVFEFPTARALAREIEGLRKAESGPARPPIVRRDEQRRAPLSVMQKRIWFMEELNPGRPNYNTPSAHRLRGPLNEAAFQQAFDAMVRRQPTLRTRIATEEGKPWQVVMDDVAIPLFPAEDLSALDTTKREAELASRLQRITDQPFDLSAGPLVRARMFRLDLEEHVLFFMPHHLIWDGWSFDLMYSELAELYNAHCGGFRARLPALPVSYGDFAEWQTRWVASPEFTDELQQARRRIADQVSTQEVPTDRPRNKGMSGRGATEWIHVDSASTDAVAALSRRTGSTMFMTLLSVYYLALFQSTGQRNLIVGTPARGRSSAEVENLMGFFTNLMPMPLRIDPAETFAAFVGRVRRAVLEAYAHTDVPFESVAESIAGGSEDGKSVLYHALFSFQDIRARPTRWGALSHEPLPLFQSGATEDLGLWFSESHTGLLGGVTYNADCFEPTTARLLRERYLDLLDAVASQEEHTVGELCAVRGKERRRLDELQASEPLRAATALAELVGSRLTDLGDRPALRDSDWLTSYRDLGVQANRIAHWLLREKPQAGYPVAIDLRDPLLWSASLVAALRVNRAVIPSVADDAARSGIEVVQMSATSAALARESTELPASSDTAADATVPAVVDMSKAGERAQPIQYSRDALHHASLSMVDAFELHDEDRVLLAGSGRVHDIVVGLATFQAGAELCCVQSNTAASEVELTAQIHRFKPTVLVAGRADWSRIVGSLAGEASAFRAVCVDGLPDAAVLASLYSTAEVVYNASTIPGVLGFAVVGRVSADVPRHGAGRPMHGLSIKVEADDSSDLPVGVIGRLVASGAAASDIDPLLAAQGRWRSDGLLEVRTLPPEPRSSAPLALITGAPVEQAGPDSEPTAPLSPMAATLAEVWRQVLSVKAALLSDNFFDLGGNSLQVMQVLEIMFERTRKRVPARRFLFDTLDHIAAAYEAAPTEAPAASGLFGRLGGLFKGKRST